MPAMRQAEKQLKDWRKSEQTQGKWGKESLVLRCCASSGACADIGSEKTPCHTAGRQSARWGVAACASSGGRAHGTLCCTLGRCVVSPHGDASCGTCTMNAFKMTGLMGAIMHTLKGEAGLTESSHLVHSQPQWFVSGWNHKSPNYR